MEKIYKLVLKSLSPIAITKRQYNILYLTEFFIPGWTILSTLIKLYALEVENGNYEEAQEIWKCASLTNFYIREENQPLLPKIIEKENQIRWGSFSEEELSRKFIASEVKVCIDPLTNTAEEGMLYEREFIKPGTEFVGEIKVTEENLGKFLETLKDKVCFVGSDKTTGFGKVKIEECNKISSNSSDCWISKVFNETEEISESPELECYVPVEMRCTQKLEHFVFPLVLRMWDKVKGAGEKIKFIGFVKFPNINL